MFLLYKKSRPGPLFWNTVYSSAILDQSSSFIHKLSWQVATGALATDVLLTSVIHSWIKVLLALTLGYSWAVVEMSSATTPPDSDPTQRRRVHNMLKLYYGLNEEGKATEQAESLDPCDINGPHFDPEIYLNKVVWWIMINSECLLFFIRVTHLSAVWRWVCCQFVLLCCHFMPHIYYSPIYARVWLYFYNRRLKCTVVWLWNVLFVSAEAGVFSGWVDGSWELYGEADQISGQWHANPGLWKLQ